MRVVDKAEDTRLKHAVALKFLPEEFASDPRALERSSRRENGAALPAGMPTR